MNNAILTSLTDFAALDLGTVVLDCVVSMAVALFIMFTYWLTYTGTAYSKKFNVALGMLVLITTMVMCAIGNNVALSLGLVGALSIVRFRTAVKDVRDQTFLFWGVAAGICCGVSQFDLVAIGSFFIFIFLIILRQFAQEGKMLLVVRGALDSENRIEAAVTAYFEDAADQTMHNASGGGCELVYTVTRAKLNSISRKRGGESVVERLMKINGVDSVNLVEQTDDIGR